MRAIDQQTRIEWEGGHLEVTKRDDGSVHVQIGNEDQVGVGLNVEETARLAAGFHAMFPAVSPEPTDLAAEAFLQSVADAAYARGRAAERQERDEATGDRAKLLAAVREHGHVGAPHDTLGHYRGPERCSICAVVAAIQDRSERGSETMATLDVRIDAVGSGNPPDHVWLRAVDAEGNTAWLVRYEGGPQLIDAVGLPAPARALLTRIESDRR